MWGPLIREDNLILSIYSTGLSISIGSKPLIYVQSNNSCGITVSSEYFYGTSTQQTLYEAYTDLVKQKPITEKYNNSCKNEIILSTNFDSFYVLDYKVDLEKENICIIKINTKEKLIDIFIPISISKNNVNRFNRHLIEGSEDDFWKMLSIAPERENDIVLKEEDSFIIIFTGGELNKFSYLFYFFK